MIPGQNIELTAKFTAVRAHWFWMKALRNMWWEECMLVPEEMKRTYQFFSWHEHDLLQRAKQLEGDGKEAAASYSRRCVMRNLPVLYKLTNRVPLNIRQAGRYNILQDICKRDFGDMIDLVRHILAKGESLLISVD